MDPYKNYFSNLVTRIKSFFTECGATFSRVWFHWKNQSAFVTGLSVGVVLFVVFMFFATPPNDFPIQTEQEVGTGSSLHSITEQFHKDNIIKNKRLFEIFAIIFGGSRDIKAGDYFFERPLPVFEVAWRIVKGDTRLAPISVTVFEGETRQEMAERIATILPDFSVDEFMFVTKGKEGYLFPDTYYFKKRTTATEVATVLEQTFYQKVETIMPELEAFGYSFDDVIIMASIVERESADGIEEKRMIAGILWNRIKKGMRLQVDAPFKIINGKGSSQLSTEDLKTDNPYNTYTHDGLPPGPISNPGFESIKATITPTKSDYLFYLHDKNGQIYYAKTNSGHVKNKQMYLN